MDYYNTIDQHRHVAGGNHQHKHQRFSSEPTTASAITRAEMNMSHRSVQSDPGCPLYRANYFQQRLLNSSLLQKLQHHQKQASPPPTAQSVPVEAPVVVVRRERKKTNEAAAQLEDVSQRRHCLYGNALAALYREQPRRNSSQLSSQRMARTSSLSSSRNSVCTAYTDSGTLCKEDGRPEGRR